MTFQLYNQEYLYDKSSWGRQGVEGGLANSNFFAAEGGQVGKQISKMLLIAGEG